MGQRPFGPYQLVQQVAVGGMAEIHLAKTSGIAGFEKYVALKMIHPNFSQDEQFIQMLIDEAKLTVQLQHVNVAQTFDLGRVGDTYYITMEYVDGADLYKILRRSSEREIDTPVDVAAYVAKEISIGLDYAHRKRDMAGRSLGIVHRDVSPQNVLISKAGEIKLVDFGIAKATMRVRKTAVGVIKGKYYYMSPEQAWGDPLDHRSDVFSTGIVLYEMLTGQMLYLEEDLHRLLDMVRKANIAPPSKLRRDIPPQLERIVMHALAKNPDDRYQTASDFATDLERFLHVYSPVFTASKVQKYYDRILGEPAAPEISVVPETPRDPSLSTKQFSREQLIRERSELTDENSVIFRVSDLAPPPRDGWEEPTAAEGAGARARSKRAPSRAPHVQTLHVEATGTGRHSDPEPEEQEEEERTVISGPPGFGVGAASIPVIARDGEPTYVSADVSGSFDEGPTVTQHIVDDRSVGSVGRIRDADDVTNPNLSHGASGAPPTPASRRSVSDGIPRPTMGRSSPAALGHPALLARGRPPAVSALRKPRRSRRTPPAGVPAVPGGGSDSMLSALVESAAGAPTAPLRGGNAVPQSIIPSSSSAPTEPARRSAPPTVPPGAPPPIPGGHQLPAVPAGRAPTGFPLAAPQTPNPLVQFPAAEVQHPGSQPLVSPFPVGQPPASLTKQLAALELDEIPEHFKLGGRTRKRWLFMGGLAAVLVGLGIAVVVTLSDGDRARTTARIRIDSQPRGAKVAVNGEQLSQPTPVYFDNAAIGKRYSIEARLKGYKPKTKEILLENDTDQMLYMVKIPYELVISSRPNADVYVDSVKIGRTPLRQRFEQEAPDFVELRVKGFAPERRSLEWPESHELTLAVTMKKK